MKRLAVGIFFVLAAVGCSSGDGATTTTVAPATTTTSGVDVTTTTTAQAPGETTTTTLPPTTATTISFEETRLATDLVADGFEQPVLLTNAGDDRLFVVEQPGRIRILRGGEATMFLDITDRVGFGGERGLLGLAFHPDYEENGRFYVNYIDRGTGATRIVEFTVSDDPEVADAGSARLVMSIDQPAGNHNGGMIVFGPDGNLWIGMGDGGGADDVFGTGQSATSFLGSMLRITVGPGIEPYATPEGSEFGAAEIWAIGLRNPWRFAIDGDDLWVADVGQGSIEEVNRVSIRDVGLNFGWPIMEGSRCFRGGCDPAGLVLPVTEYDHGQGCSVTGGFVYRGVAMPQLGGHYFYSDFCSGFLRSIDGAGLERDWTGDVGSLGRVTSFGVDSAGEVYVMNIDGAIYRLVPG